MSDQVLIVRHVGGETEYDTTSFRTEDKTGILLVFADTSQRELVAAYNANGWVAADFVDKVVIEDGATEVRAEGKRTV